MAAVIGIIGYTHGVRLVSTPPANSAGSASAGLPLSIWAIEPSCTGMGSEVEGLTAALGAPSYPLKLQGHSGGVMSLDINAPRRSTVRRAALFSVFALPALAMVTPGVAGAQSAPVVTRSAGAVDNSALHMEMTPLRAPVPGDSARAAAVAAELRRAIEKYRDTTAAVADGFRMFAPQIRNQKVYHFTRGLNAVQEAFRFDPGKPTSLLYTKGADGR